MGDDGFRGTFSESAPQLVGRRHDQRETRLFELGPNARMQLLGRLGLKSLDSHEILFGHVNDLGYSIVILCHDLFHVAFS